MPRECESCFLELFGKDFQVSSGPKFPVLLASGTCSNIVQRTLIQIGESLNTVSLFLNVGLILVLVDLEVDLESVFLNVL